MMSLDPSFIIMKTKGNDDYDEVLAPKIITILIFAMLALETRTKMLNS